MVNCSFRANMYKRVCRDYFATEKWFTDNCKSKSLADEIICIIKFIPKTADVNHIKRDSVSKSLDMCEKPIFHPAFRL
jgi:hypothetical protein